MTRRMVVVGAGPGGLAASMLLARAGVDVTLLERRSAVGGRTSSIREDGFRFDMGPTFFLYPRVLCEIFEACGYDLREEVRLKRLDPQYHLVFEQGGDLLATPDVGRMRERVAALSREDASRFEAFLSDNRKKLAAFRPVLESSFGSMLDLMKLNPFTSLPLVRPWSSVDRDLRKYFSDPRVRLAFSFQSKYLGMSPMRCPSLFTILSFLEYEHGVWHPEGGCGEISEAMASVAERMGVRIRLDEPVTGLSLSGRRVTGVRTPRGEYDADAIVINADFARAMESLVPDRLRRRWKDRRLEKKKYSCSTFMLYLGIRGRYDELAHHTIFLPHDYEDNLEDIEIRHRLSRNPAVYVQNAGVTDDTLAPPGCSTLYVLVPVTHQHPNVDWGVERDRFEKLAFKQLAKLGIHDVEERIVTKRVFTPVTWQQELNIYKGATFNLAHTFGQMLHLRPKNRFDELDGVYLVGGGTHPGSGLPVIYESARISTRLALGDLGVRQNWPRSESVEWPAAMGSPALAHATVKA